MAGMETIEIIEADMSNAAHRVAVVALINDYARDPMGQGGDLAPEVQERLGRGLATHPTALIFLAYCGDQAVGVAVCFVGFSTFAARPLINIHDLAVRSAHRARGVGQQLLESVAAKARQLGCGKLTLEVRADNVVAQRLYRRLGFGDEGTATWYWTKPLDVL